MLAARTVSLAALIALCGSLACDRSHTATSSGKSVAGQPSRHRGTSGLAQKQLRGLSDQVLRVWPVGDSITEGVEGGYRNQLYDLLRKEGLHVDFVGTRRDESTKVADKDNDGHPGFTISNARENVDAWLTKVETPDVVLLMLGTNDFAWWTNVSVKEHHGYLIDLVDHLLTKLPDSVVVVATIPPQSSKLVEDVKLDRQAMASEYNAMVRTWLPTHPQHERRLFLADVGKELSVSDLYDGIHPSGSAHQKIARVWYDSLARALPKGP